MKVTLKLYASLTQFLPPGSGRHEAELEVAEGTTPAAIIDRHQLPLELTHLVFINGVFVDRHLRDQTALQEGDHLAIFPPVAGG